MPTRHCSVFRRLGGLLIAWLLAVAVVSTQAPAPAGKGFIWKLERDGRVGWLVGSIHVLTPDYYPLPESMQKAFWRAVTLVEEIDYNEMNSPEVAQAVAAKAFYTGGKSLQTEVSPETLRLLNERIARAGLPLEPFQRMKPWMIALTLLGVELKRGGFDPALGLDKHFHDRAARGGKRFEALETAIEQIDMFDSLNAEIQDELVREQLETAESELAQIRAMADAWRAGDAETLERVLLGTLHDSARAYDVLIVKRNRAWMPRIESCLDRGHCFVVVGAGHVVGPDGLLTMLKEKGYAIEQQ